MSLWTHQELTATKAKSRFGIFFDPGCGKTLTAIEIRNRRAMYAKTLVVAPLNVCPNWLEEIEKFAIDKTVTLLPSTTKAKKLKAIENYRQGFLVVNTESLRSDYYIKALLTHRFEFVIFDESHQLNSPTSSQTKGAHKLINALQPRYLYCLTGTPSPNGEKDLWSFFTMIGTNSMPFYVWRKKYFYDANDDRKGRHNYWPDWKVRPASRVHFAEILQKNSHRVELHEAVDLPEYVQVQRHCPMTPEQTVMYKSMEKFLFARDEETGAEATATTILTRTLRLQQIIAGCLEDKEIAHNRIDVLKDIVLSLGKKQFLIWSVFATTYKPLAAALDELNISYGFITGNESQAEKTQSREDFQAGKLQALIVHPKAGGIGVNLTAAQYSIRYTRNYSLVDYLQSRARNYRGGSIDRHDTVVEIDIVTPGSVDVEIMKALHEKKEKQDFLLRLREVHEAGN